MEEYAIFRDYKKAMDHREAETVNVPLRYKYMNDPEELEYWRQYFVDDIEIEQEINEPF